jgi:hypothetical protein
MTCYCGLGKDNIEPTYSGFPALISIGVILANALKPAKKNSKYFSDTPLLLRLLPCYVRFDEQQRLTCERQFRPD